MNSPQVESRNPSNFRMGSKQVTRWAAVLVLVPLPLWFSVMIALDPGPVWRAQYWHNREFSGSSSSGSERQLSSYWDRQNSTLSDGSDARTFSARWDTCMKLDTAQEIPFMLVAMGVARFEIDGVEKLQVAGERERQTRGDVLRLEAGMHQLSVVFSARGWPSVALNASFDGRAPVAFPANTRAPGIHFTHPGTGAAACSERD
jgi:hypothetical protein